ncbi:putative fibroblast growth factor 1 [Ptychodera flava]|uniref:putative fibroblast growth factor 1 n=1 Tax=Ptychodera flava TaxID=63121 RepID=UPI00396A1561
MNFQIFVVSFVFSTFFYRLSSAFVIPQGAPAANETNVVENHHHDETSYNWLHCKNGYNLQILPNGTVKGVRGKDEYAVIDISNAGVGLVSLRGVASELYVSMTRRGTVHAEAVILNTSHFYEEIGDDNYHTYWSSVDPSDEKKMFLAVNSFGYVRKKQNRTKQMTHFVRTPLTSDDRRIYISRLASRPQPADS